MSEFDIHKEFPNGAEIFREGERGDCAYIVERGTVEISTQRTGERLVLARRGTGEIFGEMSIIDDEPRSATVTALGDVRLLVVTRSHLTNRITTLDPVLRMVPGVIPHRFRDSIRHMRGELLDAAASSPSSNSASNEERLSAYRAAIERIELELQLKRSLAEGELALFFQPIISSEGGGIVGFEALARWRHPERGLLPPGEFIKLAEECGLIQRLSAWAFAEACRSAAAIQASVAFEHPVFVSVNVTAQDICSSEFFEIVQASLAAAAVRDALLTLEITESTLMNNPALALKMLERYRELGLTISIDDFGAGFSNLGYLALYPVQILKIDKGFVDQLAVARRGEHVIRAMVQLGHVLGMKIVAEGVETQAQAIMLRTVGVDCLQGYLFGKPQPLEHWMSVPDGSSAPGRRVSIGAAVARATS